MSVDVVGERYAIEGRRRGLMGPEPVFGPRLSVSLFSEDVWDRIVGAPGVRPNRSGQAFHNVPLVMCIVADVVGVI